MANFLAKSRTESTIPSTDHKEAAEATDFDKVFKPFALRKGIEMVPINYFGTRLRSLDGVEENPIVVLDGATPPPSLPAPLIRYPPVNLPGVIHISLSQRIPTKPRLKTAFVILSLHYRAQTLQDIGHEPSFRTPGILFAQF